MSFNASHIIGIWEILIESERKRSYPLVNTPDTTCKQTHAAKPTSTTSVPFPQGCKVGKVTKSAALPLITEDDQLQHNIYVTGVYCINLYSLVNESLAKVCQAEQPRTKSLLSDSPHRRLGMAGEHMATHPNQGRDSLHGAWLAEHLQYVT